LFSVQIRNTKQQIRKRKHLKIALTVRCVSPRVETKAITATDDGQRLQIRFGQLRGAQRGQQQQVVRIATLEIRVGYFDQLL
jgi:hypothetical protein